MPCCATHIIKTKGEQRRKRSVEKSKHVYMSFHVVRASSGSPESLNKYTTLSGGAAQAMATIPRLVLYSFRQFIYQNTTNTVQGIKLTPRHTAPAL